MIKHLVILVLVILILVVGCNLNNPKVENMLALHVLPEMEVGNVGFRSGKYMAACDEIYIKVNGKGGHAALPDQVINPIIVAAHLMIKIKKVLNKRTF